MEFENTNVMEENTGREIGEGEIAESKKKEKTRKYCKYCEQEVSKTNFYLRHRTGKCIKNIMKVPSRFREPSSGIGQSEDNRQNVDFHRGKAQLFVIFILIYYVHENWSTLYHIFSDIP